MSGGVIPNGPDGITKGPLQEQTAITAGESGGIARLADFDQPTAEAILKAIFIQGNASISGVVELIFNGLRQGISLPLAIIESIAKKILGLPTDFAFFNVDHALSMLKKVPLISDFVEAITGVEDGDLEDLGTWFLNLRNFFGSLNFLDPDFDVADAAGVFIELVLWPVNKLATLVAGVIPGAQIPLLDPTKILTLPGLFVDAITGFSSFFTKWFNKPSTATTVAMAVAESTVAIESITTSIKGGWTLQTITASNAAWVVPTAMAEAEECLVGVFGGGGRGFEGDANASNTLAIGYGGLGGKGGGYALARVDPATLPATLAVVVGAAATTAGANGGVSSISASGTPLVTSVPGIGSISTPEGYQDSSSKPGDGGKGGDGWSIGGSAGPVTNGMQGGASATAAGGAGGTGATSSSATAGSAGGAGTTASMPLAGGGGGGGGGGRYGFGATAPNGGNGGFPGGGSGGGGGSGANGGTPHGGTPGTPAQGMAFVLYRGTRPA